MAWAVALKATTSTQANAAHRVIRIVFEDQSEQAGGAGLIRSARVAMGERYIRGVGVTDKNVYFPARVEFCHWWRHRKRR